MRGWPWCNSFKSINPKKKLNEDRTSVNIQTYSYADILLLIHTCSYADILLLIHTCSYADIFLLTAHAEGSSTYVK